MTATTKSGRQVELIDRYADLMHTPEFTIIHDGVRELEACTSLTEADAAVRANLIPPADGWTWHVAAGGTLHCHHQKPDHRHVLLVAVRG